MRISDWSSDVCAASVAPVKDHLENSRLLLPLRRTHRVRCLELVEQRTDNVREFLLLNLGKMIEACSHRRSEEHTSELQSLMRISYAVFCLKKKHNTVKHSIHNNDEIPHK